MKLIRPGNMFPVINSPMPVLTGQARLKALSHAISKGTQVGLQLRNPILIMFHWMVCMLTPVDGPALKFIAICRRVALLSHWTILFSRHWPHSCRIFFRPQQCQRFDVLLDSRYLWCTREMVIWEYPQCIATLEMLCANYNT